MKTLLASILLLLIFILTTTISSLVDATDPQVSRPLVKIVAVLPKNASNIGALATDNKDFIIAIPYSTNTVVRMQFDPSTNDENRIITTPASNISIPVLCGDVKAIAVDPTTSADAYAACGNGNRIVRINFRNFEITGYSQDLNSNTSAFTSPTAIVADRISVLVGSGIGTKGYFTRIFFNNLSHDPSHSSIVISEQRITTIAAGAIDEASKNAFFCGGGSTLQGIVQFCDLSNINKRWTHCASAELNHGAGESNCRSIAPYRDSFIFVSASNNDGGIVVKFSVDNLQRLSTSPTYESGGPVEMSGMMLDTASEFLIVIASAKTILRYRVPDLVLYETKTSVLADVRGTTKIDTNRFFFADSSTGEVTYYTYEPPTATKSISKSLSYSVSTNNTHTVETSLSTSLVSTLSNEEVSQTSTTGKTNSKEPSRTPSLSTSIFVKEPTTSKTISTTIKDTTTTTTTTTTSTTTTNATSATFSPIQPKNITLNTTTTSTTETTPTTTIVSTTNTTTATTSTSQDSNTSTSTSTTTTTIVTTTTSLLPQKQKTQTKTPTIYFPPLPTLAPQVAEAQIAAVATTSTVAATLAAPAAAQTLRSMSVLGIVDTEERCEMFKQRDIGAIENDEDPVASADRQFPESFLPFLKISSSSVPPIIEKRFGLASRRGAIIANSIIGPIVIACITLAIGFARMKFVPLFKQQEGVSLLRTVLAAGRTPSLVATLIGALGADGIWASAVVLMTTGEVSGGDVALSLFGILISSFIIIAPGVAFHMKIMKQKEENSSNPIECVEAVVIEKSFSSDEESTKNVNSISRSNSESNDAAQQQRKPRGLLWFLLGSEIWVGPIQDVEQFRSLFATCRGMGRRFESQFTRNKKIRRWLSTWSFYVDIALTTVAATGRAWAVTRPCFADHKVQLMQFIISLIAFFFSLIVQPPISPMRRGAAIFANFLLILSTFVLMILGAESAELVGKCAVGAAYVATGSSIILFAFRRIYLPWKGIRVEADPSSSCAASLSLKSLSDNTSNRTNHNNKNNDGVDLTDFFLALPFLDDGEVAANNNNNNNSTRRNQNNHEQELETVLLSSNHHDDNMSIDIDEEFDFLNDIVLDEEDHNDDDEQEILLHEELVVRRDEEDTLTTMATNRDSSLDRHVRDFVASSSSSSSNQNQNVWDN